MTGEGGESDTQMMEEVSTWRKITQKVFKVFLSKDWDCGSFV